MEQRSAAARRATASGDAPLFPVSRSDSWDVERLLRLASRR